MRLFSIITLFILNTVPLLAQEISLNPNENKDTTRKSIKAAANGMIDDATVQINYYSPAVRGRIIWGGLVPYEEVWVTGAHRATNIQINKSFKIEDKIIPAGEYAIFTIPGKTKWTFILNKNFQQHLTDEYDMKDDLIRIQIQPIEMTYPLERLQYFIESSKISIAWDKLKIEIPISILK